MPPLKNSSGRLVIEDRDKAQLPNLQFRENVSQEDASPFCNCTWPCIPEITVWDHGLLQLLTGNNIN